ncbi:hypothetical protein NQ317_004679 [Molorchus minor]|uniref:Maturase K n=1 Tax=Molorchus minor TaxID=1323400 RepID=A0ABQ9JFF2_9CUCU|nr:hypothetical protein NQ317_004679 [Molorchus minor]
MESEIGCSWNDGLWKILFSQRVLYDIQTMKYFDNIFWIGIGEHRDTNNLLQHLWRYFRLNAVDSLLMYKLVMHLYPAKTSSFDTSLWSYFMNCTKVGQVVRNCEQHCEKEIFSLSIVSKQ